jgi:uncharacterized membrane protein SpoIIM required for sporulation
MVIDEFYTRRKGDWEKLTLLLDRYQGGRGRFSSSDVHALGRLYRSATADLALAQRDYPNDRLTEYLNQLVARAHAIVYRGEPMTARRIWRFISGGYAREYRQAAPFMLAAILLFFIPAILAGIGAGVNPQLARWLLPESAQDVIPIIERQQLWTDIPVGLRPFASSFIMLNNIRVAILAFGAGILGCVFTVWIMVLNGLTLGGILGLTFHYGIGFDLLTFVIGHGVVELSVTFIAGGTGLMLGWAVLHPGSLHRRDAVALAAQRAIRLLGGCIPLLVVAGLIEGFISPAGNLPWVVKWGMGLGSGLMLYGHLLIAGRERGRPIPN